MLDWTYVLYIIFMLKHGVNKHWRKWNIHTCRNYKYRNIPLYSDLKYNLNLYCTHLLYYPAQLSWLDFTALYRPLRRVPLSLLSLYEPKWRDTVPEHKVQEHGVQEHKVLEHVIQEHKVFEHRVLEHRVLEHRVQEHVIQEHVIQEYKVQEYRAKDQGVQEHVS